MLPRTKGFPILYDHRPQLANSRVIVSHCDGRKLLFFIKFQPPFALVHIYFVPQFSANERVHAPLPQTSVGDTDAVMAKFADDLQAGLAVNITRCLVNMVGSLLVTVTGMGAVASQFVS